SELAARMQVMRENTTYLPGVRLAENVRVTADLRQSLVDAECVVFAIPSAGMREVAAAAAPYIPPTALLVNASKGLEDTTGLRLSEIIEYAFSTFQCSSGLRAEGRGPMSEEVRSDKVARLARLPNHQGTRSPGRGHHSRLTVLSGPNFALEVARGIPTASVAASTDPESAERCRALWMGPTFRVYTSTDLLGVELAGAMKNVIAIAAGICEGLGYGDNSRAALMTRGLAEMTRLGLALGARQATFLGLAGVGDLIATGGSRLSRNYRVGIGLGQGKPLDAIIAGLGQVAEGVPTTRAICLLGRRAGVELPISEGLYRVLFEGASVREELIQLMLRPPKEESESRI
ncbi:MAG TPA: NAD(P)H-dependent glycerol-3-phosphate dehydrogenase, partial [Chthonomonadales bacterium]|nr:NAD(P)H-dependent glycerol-3-phosphate dehydrogenase [Chthonomonadales bacterium]